MAQSSSPTKPLVNLSIIEEEDKALYTQPMNSCSENDGKRNFSGFFPDDPHKNLLKQASSSRSLAVSAKPEPKLLKKNSSDLANKAKRQDSVVEHEGKGPPDQIKKQKSISEYLKSTNDDKYSREKSITSLFVGTEKTLTSEKKIQSNADNLGSSDHKGHLLSNSNEHSACKTQKVKEEMKNFVRRKLSMSEFEELVHSFLRFKTGSRPEARDEPAILAYFTNLWEFFYSAIEIVLYVHKECKFLLARFKKNFKDVGRIRESFEKYHRHEEYQEYLSKHKWKGYLEELMKCQEMNDDIVNKLNLFANMLGFYLEESSPKPSEHELSENLFSDKVFELFSFYEGQLKALNSYAGLTSISEERLAILTKVEKKESFLHFVDFFNEEVKNRHMNDLRLFFVCAMGFMQKCASMILRENDRQRAFYRGLHENCLMLTELATILTKKVQNLVLLKKSTNDKISSLMLPFHEHQNKNFEVLAQAEKNFDRILHKVKKARKKVKVSRDRFPLNFFLNMRELHCINLLEELDSLEKETRKDLAILPFFKEYPNYELEILNVQGKCQKYQEDFKFKEDKDRVRDKIIWLSGKLHNMRVFMIELERDGAHTNAILKMLYTSLQTHLSSTYKLYDFLLKIMNSVHANELQKIKLIESEVDNLLEVLSVYYETMSLPPGKQIDEALLDMKSKKLEIENFNMLNDLPDIYRDICSAKSSQLEQEIEKLEIFEELKARGRERVDYNWIRKMILSCTYEKKCPDLEEYIKELERYRSLMKYLTRIHSSIQNIIQRVLDIIDVLKIFEQAYSMFFSNFLTVSDKYEKVKSLVSSFRDILLEKLTMMIYNKEDKQFFLQSAEFFFINTKNHFQSLIPENVDHILLQTNHLVREVQGKIDNFYKNRDNMNVMAVGYTRQLHITKTIDQFLRIMEKLKHSEPEKIDKIRSTNEILLTLREVVEILLKPCQVANLFGLFLDDLIKNKHLELGVRIQKLKDMLKNLNDKVKMLEQEERKGIRDEKISGIYVYMKDDIKKVNDRILLLLPEIEEYAKYYHLVENSRLKIVLEEEVMAHLAELIKFKDKIEKNKNNGPLIFLDQNKINDFIQEYYNHWYSIINKFIQSFDWDALSKIQQCYSAASPRNLQRIMDDYVKFADKLEKKYLHDKSLLSAQAKEVRLGIHNLKNEIQEVDLAFYILNHLQIDPIKFKNLNTIQGLKEFRESLNVRFKFDLWKDILDETHRICDRWCNATTNKSLYKTMLISDLQCFGKKNEGLEGGIHRKWVDIILKIFTD